MNVAFVMSRMGAGGAERVVSVLCNKMSQLGHAVTLITTVDAESAYYISADVTQIDLSAKQGHYGMVKRIALLTKTLKESQYDAVVSFLVTSNVETILACRMAKRTVIISERNNPYIEPDVSYLRLLRKFTYWLSNGYVFQTPDAQAFFSKRIQDKGVIIPNPVNEQLPTPWGEDRSKRIVSVGRLVKQKNQRMLIKAFQSVHEKYPEYRLEIYGEGPLRNELQKYIADCGLEDCAFLPGKRTDVLSQVRDAAIFVLPSDYEGMSNALIEALCLGIPTISTDHPIGGAKMLIESGVNGVLTPVGNTEALTEKILELIETPELCQSLSENALLLRTKLNSELITSMWMEYISKCVK